MIKMGKKVVLAILISSFFSPFFLYAEKLSPKDLPEKYKKWLEEEVVYIIVPLEREVFLNLKMVKVIKDLSGIYFVHYAIEPKRLSVDLYENKYYTILKFNGTVSNTEGKRIYQFEKDVSLEFDDEQIEDLGHRPFSIRDMFPLIPGIISYPYSSKMKSPKNLLLWNETSSFLRMRKPCR